MRAYHARCGGAAHVALLELPLAGHYDVVTAAAAPWLRVWQRATAMLHEHAGWTVPARAADYGVSAERGFLPAHDPPASVLPLEPGAGAPADHACSPRLQPSP